jgi:hypothetical protein
MLTIDRAYFDLTGLTRLYRLVASMPPGGGWVLISVICAKSGSLSPLKHFADLRGSSAARYCQSLGHYT